jgi:hypothetical protein
MSDWDGSQPTTIFQQLEEELNKGYESERIPNTEFALGYHKYDDQGGWSAMAGNPFPANGALQELGGVLKTGDYPTAEEAIAAMIVLLRGVD